MENTADGGDLLRVQGLSELVRGTTASFYGSLDRIVPLDPAQTRLVGDDSPRPPAVPALAGGDRTQGPPPPLAETALTVSTEALADPLAYQQSAVRTALSDQNLRPPRILLADAVGLGKTLEIGMILSELVRRGRGERILIVCPRHVLEQMQQELWTRFALPFVRLDSAGVQRVKQKLPATRNPFTYYKRVIISMDTLKQARFERDLRRHRWDAVVIDESHNVTNVAAQNNRLARTLAPNTDALILASATPAQRPQGVLQRTDPPARPDRGEPRGRPRHRPARTTRRPPAPQLPPEVAQVVGARWPNAANRTTCWSRPTRPRTTWPGNWTRSGCTRPPGGRVRTAPATTCSAGPWPRHSCPPRPRSPSRSPNACAASTRPTRPHSGKPKRCTGSPS